MGNGRMPLIWKGYSNETPQNCWYSQDKTNQIKLEQLERLRSEYTPRRPVITLTIDQFILNPKSILLISSYRIPSQKKVKAEKIRKICEKI